MSERIFVNRTNHADKFVKIGNDLAQDYELLSATAFGWLVRILSRPPTWSLNMESMICGHHQRHSIRTTMTELRTAGFIVAVKVRQVGRFASTEYHVFDVRQTAEQIKAICEKSGGVFICPKSESQNSGRSSAGGSTTSGKTPPIKTEGNKDRDHKRIVSNETIPADCAAGLSPDEDTGLTASDIAMAGIGEDAQGEPERNDAPCLALVSEDEPDGKTFPWRQVMGALARIVPEVKMPVSGARRDIAMKAFWRKHNKTVGCFELLAQKVRASDYLMARNGHTGSDGRPFTWGWIFSKNEKGVNRADAIMEGAYTTEAMAFVLEKKAAAAAPKLTKVMAPGGSTPFEVNLAEIFEGEPRYKVCDMHPNGCPVVIDYK